MSTRRRLAVLALVAGCSCVGVLTAPADADVNCADLKTRAAAQSYLEGRTSDADGLDSDADGQACEHNDPATRGNWMLIGLGVLFAGGLITFSTDARRQARRRTVAVSVDELPMLVPAQSRSAAELEVDAGAPTPTSAPTQKETVVAHASVGSLDELARALRLVPYAKRMSLLEEHARAHGSAPQDVLDELVEHTSDLELQGWALAGYDPPWVVRPMYCSCVGGLRNYRLQTADDGSHFWACATCHSTDRSSPEAASSHGGLPG
jgi:hypothetical protein